MLYMKKDGAAVTGVPVPRPSRVDAVIGGRLYNATASATWTDAELEEYAGWIAVDPASAYDPAIHDATGGGTVSGAGLALPAYAVKPVTAEMVRNEAERRIAAGITVDALPFRADDASVGRVREMLDAFVAVIVPPAGVTFKTAAGDEFTLTTEAQARAIYEGQITHRAAVLAASAALQDTLPADYLTNAAWPAVTAVVL